MGGSGNSGAGKSRFDEVFDIVDQGKAPADAAPDSSGDDAIAAGVFALVVVLLGPILALLLERGDSGRSSLLLAGGAVTMGVGLGGSLRRSSRSLGPSLCVGGAILGVLETVIAISALASNST